ncbi:MAG: class I SAM-dependent methyltransferase [Propionibacteriaceae bacterium]
MSVEWPAAAYARSFGVLCAGTVPDLIAALRSGARLLDVGCGPGTLARAELDRFGVVHAFDREPAMLELARTGAGDDARLRVVQGSMHHLPYPDHTFDAVGANFAVNHSPDPRAAVAELVRVARPGGRVAATVWPSAGLTVNTLWNAVLDRARVEVPISVPLPPDRDFPRNSSGFGEMVAGSGLSEVSVQVSRWTFVIEPADLWAAAESGVASIGAVHAGLDPAGRRRLRAAYDVEVARSRTDDGRYRQDVTALLAVGTAPSIG